jgi:hypothetical protein
MSGTDPTDRVLVQACRAAIADVPLSSEAADAIEDWDRLLAQANLHAVAPLVHGWLSRLRVDLPPEPSLALREAVLANGRHNLLRVAELLDLLDGLTAVGVDALPFKGPVLAQAVYGNLGLRQFGDLDVLVHWSDLPAAVEVLHERGYHLEQPLQHIVAAAREGHRELPAALSLVRPRRATAVDLQTSLSNRLSFTFDHDGIWARRTTVRVGGRDVPTMGAEDLIHYLAVHGTQHGWGRLGWVVDLGLAIQRLDADWDALLDRAAERGSRRMVLLGAALGRKVLGVTLPPALELAVDTDAAVAPLVTRAERVLFGPADAALRVVVERYALQLRAWDRHRDRLHHAARATLGITMNDYAAVELPRALFPLYLAVRPFRVVSAYARH